MTIERSHNITIEKIRYNDLNDLEKIFTAAFGEEFDAELIKRRIRRIRQFYYILLPLSNLSLWLKNLFNIYICRVDGNVAGFMQVSFFNCKQLHLDYIAISKKYRGQGLGTLVLRKLLDRAARNNYDLILEVRKNNPAYSLYERMGFVEQAEILHYEKVIGDSEQEEKEQPLHSIQGVRKRKDVDWRQVYSLYLKTLPSKLRRVARREVREFNPSLFTKTMEWVKNYLMGNLKRQYVVEKHDTIVGSFELQSYLKSGSHIVNVMIDEEHERLREPLLRKALNCLRHHKGENVGTTIYADGFHKEAVLEKLGFMKTEAYYLMFRPPNPVYKRATQGMSNFHQRIGRVERFRPQRAGYAAIE